MLPGFSCSYRDGNTKPCHCGNKSFVVVRTMPWLRLCLSCALAGCVGVVTGWIDEWMRCVMRDEWANLVQCDSSGQFHSGHDCWSDRLWLSVNRSSTSFACTNKNHSSHHTHSTTFWRGRQKASGTYHITFLGQVSFGWFVRLDRFTKVSNENLP